VTESDAGSKVELSKGDILKVTLVGNPSTGFMWEPQSLNMTFLKQKGEWEFKAYNSTPGFAGSPGKLTMRLEAVGSGQTTLQLIYHQPFDAVAAPAQAFEMTVVVK
jgi:predicted secreted protein